MMFKKMLLTGVFTFVFAAVSFATDFVALTFNFYAEGDIKPVGELPPGAVMKPRVRFNNKKLPGHAYCLDINLDKVQEIEHSFTVSGNGRLVISVNPRTMKDGKRQKAAPRVKCIRMVVNGKPAKVPFVFNKWRYAANPIMVKDGDKITIDAAFEDAN